MGDLLQVESNAMEDRLPAFATPLSNPDPLSITDETWGTAEETTTHQVLNCIHPTLDSEERRKDVTEYVQRLIRHSLGVEVFSYGSVPLKTYLPDGDIDLTALSIPNVEENLARDVLAVLQGEEHNEHAEYEVKDTQFIDAEVKLVKCLVQNIVIDISFNQLGGLCTLCFLEQVDRVVCKDHLFKRSIILIKAWCYYESRILGAHHGLISTYALETLVLYIFHVFNPSLNGPLAVLYRFLDYFSRFDWENYCVSLDGPVCKSSLPDIVVEKPENGGNDLMLSEEFLRNCIDMFSVPSRGLETNLRAFTPKHLNIIDPLKENNNLGRSVHRGNFFRIRSAFRYGARKLGRILQLPKDRIADEIKKFFASTLERHGRKYGPDTALIFGAKGFGSLSTSSHSEMFLEDKIYSKFSNVDFDDSMSGAEDKSNLGSTEGSLSGHHLVGDANDLSPRSSQLSSSHSGRNYYAPHFYFSGSSTANGNLEDGYFYQDKPSDSVNGKNGLDLWIKQGENQLVDGDTVCLSINNHDHVNSSDSAISSQDANVPDSLTLDFREMGLASSAGETEILNPLSDLTGDYDSHIRSLLYGQCCHGYALSAPVLRTSPPTSPLQFRNKPWETGHRSMPLNQNFCSQVNANGVVVGPPSYPIINNSTPASAPFAWEERQKARGTGAYFPVMNGGCPCKERPSRGRGRDRAPGTNGHLQRARIGALADTNSLSEPNHELPNQGHGKSGLSRQTHHPVPTKGDSHPPAQGISNVNNNFSHSQRKLEFGSFGPLADETSNAGASMPSLAKLEVQQSSKLVYDSKQERTVEKSFHLKNEDEFPPLSAGIS